MSELHPCSIDDCALPVFARGWCRHHYDSVRTYGDPHEMRWYVPGQTEPLVCDCPTSTPEHIPIFGTWQCSRCYRKCDPPAAVVLDEVAS